MSHKLKATGPAAVKYPAKQPEVFGATDSAHCDRLGEKRRFTTSPKPTVQPKVAIMIEPLGLSEVA